MSAQPRLFDLSPPPAGTPAVEVMKWMISVMDANDTSLMFVASVLAQSIKWGGMTERQEAGIVRIYERVLDAFDRGVLAIQGGGIAEDENAPHNVTHLTARRGKGGAS